jgi:hypothetical protein
MALRPLNNAQGRNKQLGHEDGDEGQQENENSASDGNHDGDVFHDTFNWVFGSV